jgi:hypothetical protein
VAVLPPAGPRSRPGVRRRSCSSARAGPWGGREPAPVVRARCPANIVERESLIAFMARNETRNVTRARSMRRNLVACISPGTWCETDEKTRMRLLSSLCDPSAPAWSRSANAPFQTKRRLHRSRPIRDRDWFRFCPPGSTLAPLRCRRRAPLRWWSACPGSGNRSTGQREPRLRR